jgi:deoxyribodipyrimidine photolyase-related protein
MSKKEVVLIFPHQLFKINPNLDKNREVFLIEEARFFTDFNFHKKKLLLHRASMKYFESFLKKKGLKVRYFNFNQSWEKHLKGKTIYYTELIDHQLEKKIPKRANKLKSPAFITEAFEKRKRYFMTGFYTEQRRNFNLLMKNGKPMGGKFSFDKDNRKKIPKDVKIPQLTSFYNQFIKEGVAYVNKHFSKNPGSTDGFIYPVTHADSQKWLKDFIKHRLKLFGDYEDAMLREEPFLFHSICSPLLNIGLLTPDEVIDETQKAKAPLNSKEGFLRQVLGWREFIKHIYDIEGEHQRRSNFFKHQKKLTNDFYTGETKIDPLDVVIKRVLQHAYCHHIERLMVVGNYMLLSEIHPNEVYRWFMELFIDAYDWVMVPNVYGMSQYADGGLMTTKPYFSSSNYLLKMSDFKRGEWCEVWNSLFWKFMKKHKRFLSKNPRLAMLIKTKFKE